MHYRTDIGISYSARHLREEMPQVNLMDLKGQKMFHLRFHRVRIAIFQTSLPYVSDNARHSQTDGYFEMRYRYVIAIVKMEDK